ncbi:DUF6266 family protein [Sphingobacterium chuzhouense]|uniref:Uncharacterized protein n=1 Tax=Sphingobacterium chuzhouense TaxID=1742264 RepID=A0ABR7XPY3_9SPHI|nr:DUF6266 family protein [Sphingobacterium chuzhouense]MBD1421235.1 hypothetical protein [Sphingobacterium chuzhouense]
MIVHNGISSLVDGRTLARLRFRSASKFLAPLAALIKQGLGGVKKPGTTPMGKAMSHLLTSGFSGKYPGLEIDPGKVKLSDGNLDNPQDVQVALFRDNVNISWSTEMLNPFNAHDDDVILVCAYSVAARYAVLQEGVVQRKDGQAIVVLPAVFLREITHLYLLTHTRDGKRFSRNIYLGACTAENGIIKK